MGDEKKRTSKFVTEQQKDAREMIKEMRGYPCGLCNGYGFIDICDGIGPRVKCPRCNDGRL